MGLYEQVMADMKTAMKAKEKDRLTTLRAIKSELLLIKTSGSDAEISEEQEIRLLQKLAKQRRESAELYNQKGRTDLSEKELAELKYIEEYLPKQLTDDELTAAIKEIITETGATSMKDMGKVMGKASKQLAGKAEGKAIAGKVKQLLST